MHAFIYSTYTYTPSQYIFSIIPETSIGIEDIRAAQKFASTLPPKNQIHQIIIHDAHYLTIPAQNAFLKTLEEPPTQCEIILITRYPSKLLPTILSRVEIKNQKSIYTSDTLEQSRKIFDQLQKAGVGERLAVIDQIPATRESFLHFLNDLEFILYSQLPQFPQLPKLYSLLVQTKTYTQANCNIRLVLDHFATHLSSL